MRVSAALPLFLLVGGHRLLRTLGVRLGQWEYALSHLIVKRHEVTVFAGCFYNLTLAWLNRFSNFALLHIPAFFTYLPRVPPLTVVPILLARASISDVIPVARLIHTAVMPLMRISKRNHKPQFWRAFLEK